MFRTLGPIVVVAALAATASAELKQGDVPAPLGYGARFVMGEEITLQQLRGRVVAIQLAHTSSKPTAEHVPKIHELLEKYGEKGFVFLWVFEEPAAEVKAFATKAGAKFPVVAGFRDVRERYGLLKGFPTTYVLGLDGKVAWAGNFVDRADDTIAGLLKGISDLPWLPAKHGAITLLLKGKKYVEARAALVAASTPRAGEPELSFDDIERIGAALAWLDAIASKLAKKADEMREAGDVYAAYEAYRELRELHAGSESAANADAAIEELLADKKTKREIEAWIFFEERFAEASKIELTDRKKAIKLLNKVVSRYRGSKAAEKAKYWVERLQEQ
jgi:hypothetical protein